MLDTNTIPTGETLVPPCVSPVIGDGLESLLAKLLHVLSGGSGATVVADTNEQNYRALGFTVLTDTVFDVATGYDGYTTTGLTGVTFPAGTTLPFRLSTFTLTSGTVLAILA